jgi:hypothetical protein
MSTPPPDSLRQRGGQSKKKKPQSERSTTPSGEGEKAAHQSTPDLRLQPVKSSEWDYKLGLTIVTILAFLTRFYGISHPNQVVFDEVHFGKVPPTSAPVFPSTLTRPSLPRITSKEPTFSTYTPPSESFSSHSQDGLLDIAANFSSKTSVTRTSRTKSRTSHIAPFPP